MKKILILLSVALLAVGCSSSDDEPTGISGTMVETDAVVLEFIPGIGTCNPEPVTEATYDHESGKLFVKTASRSLLLYLEFANGETLGTSVGGEGFKTNTSSYTNTYYRIIGNKQRILFANVWLENAYEPDYHIIFRGYITFYR